MKPIDALRQADRHCDMEGLPPASAEARALDAAVAAGRLHPADAVRRLVQHHAKADNAAPRRSRVA